MKVLVVDDAAVARKMVARMVESLGFEVDTAENGEDAMTKLDLSAPPAAIVTDWNMPVMDGVELARMVRRTPDLMQLPVLMISSEADPRRVAKALMAGGFAFDGMHALVTGDYVTPKSGKRPENRAKV